MKAHRLIKLIMLLITLSSSLEAAQNEAHESTSYKITIQEASLNSAQVSARFTPQSDSFYMFYGANNFRKRWAEFVDDLEVKTVSGRRIDVKQNEDGSWHLTESLQEPIELNYKVRLDHENHRWSGGVDGAAYAREDGVFYTARSLFVVNGTERQNINVSFDVPDSWKVSTPWPEGNSKNHFVVKDMPTLSTSLFFAGKHFETQIKSDNLELTIAIGTEVQKQQEELAELAEGVFQYYANVFGGLPKQSEESVTKALVVVSSARQTDGEAIGNNISILLSQEDDPMQQLIARFIFAHEFFHLWHGKSFTPVPEELEWFKEGVSNYYTIKALHQVGYLNDESFIDVFENFFYQRYISDKAVGQFSITEGARKHSNWGLIYSGGLMTGVALDMLIRNSSANKDSLDSVMRELYNSFYGEKRYDTDDLKAIINKFHSPDLTPFYRDYLHGNGVIPIEEYLKFAGIIHNKSEQHLGLSLKENALRKEKVIREGMFGKIKE